MTYEGPTDNEIFAEDADYDALVERLTDNEKPLVAYIKHITKAHKEGIAAVRAAGGSDKTVEITLAAVFAALLANQVWKTERPNLLRAFYLIDRLTFFKDAYASRIKSLGSSQNV